MSGAGAVWAAQVAQELRSAGVFAELARLSGDASFGSARDDELRHAELCCDVAGHLGESPDRLVDDGPLLRRLEPLTDGRLRHVSLLLVEIAVGETLSTSLFRASAQKAREPVVRAALRAITRDEARHARLGWTSLDALWPTLTPDELAFSNEELRRHLGGAERDHALPALQALERGEPFDLRLEAFGVLSPETRIDCFYFALERQVFPRLRRLGLDAGVLWARRYER